MTEQERKIVIHFLETSSEEKLNRFYQTLCDEMQKDDEPTYKKAQNLIWNVLWRDAENAIINLCGWSLVSLLKKALLIPDTDGTFYQGPIDARFISVWDGGSTSIDTACKVDPATLKVYDIEQAPEDLVNSVTTLDGEYVFFNPYQKYPVVTTPPVSLHLAVDFWRE